MKLIYIFISSLILSSSCCTKKLRIATLNISYSSVNSPTILNIYSIDNDYEQVRHSQYKLNSKNDYSYKIYFPSESLNYEYRLVLGDSISLDVISEMSYELGGHCNHDLKNYQYKLNGTLYTTNQINL